MKIIWKPEQFKKAVGIGVDEILKEGAERILSDARANVPVKTGTLQREIEVKVSKYDGYIVQAQGPKNYDRYYASFVELGTWKMKARPYLRPALKKNKGWIKNEIQRALK